MAQEIYHRSEWGNPTETWGNTYLNADLTNELYKRASEYENSWVTDQLLNGVGIKPSIILTPTAYDDGKLLSVKPAKTFGSELVTNGDFSDGANDWFILGSGASLPSGDVNNGVLSIGGAEGFTQNVVQLIGDFNQNEKIKVIVKAKIGQSGPNLKLRLSTDIYGANLINIVSGVPITSDYQTFEYEYKNTTVNNYKFFSFREGNGSGSILIDSITIKKVTDADFDFTRGSSATRVNEQGLVSDVQILSGELVQNGDFEEIGSEEISNGDFEQIGSELVVNGDFATDSDWTLGNGWSISGGKAILVDGLDPSYQIYQSISGLNTKNLKVTFDVTDFSGDAELRYPFRENITGNGSYTFYGVGTLDRVQFQVKSGFTASFSIDNVSVKEVGQDWTFQNGWNMGNGVAVYSGTSSAYRKLYQENILTIGKIYKLTFDIVSINSGSIKNFSQSSPTSYSTIGTKTEYFTATYDDLFLEPTTDANLSIDNVSVKEVGQNWEFGTGWSIEDGKAYRGVEASGSNLQQNSILTIGKKYKVTLDVLENTGTNKVFIGSGTAFTLSGTGTQTFTGNCSSNTTLYIQASNHNSAVKVDNISLIEVTDDTDLPRINYTNFDYKDVLGDELVTNGDYSDGTNNWTPNTNATLSVENGRLKVAISGDGSGYPYQNITTEVGKLYKVTADAFIGTSSRLALYNNADGQFNNLYADGSFDFTFVATSTSTQLRLYVYDDGAYGFWDNISVKELTEDVVVPYSGEGSLLFENQSTNLFTYSEDFSQSFWNKASSSVTLTSQIAPNGTSNSVYNLVGTAANLYANGVTGVQHTLSFYIKSNNQGKDKFKLRLGNNTSVEYTATNEWVRYEYTETPTTSVFGITTTSAPNNEFDLLVWGGQSEQGSYATSYIPTNGSTVTRLADVCNNAGSSDLINSTEGVLYAEIAALVNDSSVREISLSDGTANNRIELRYGAASNRLQLVARSSGSVQASISNSDYNILLSNKVAIKYKANDFALWINGVEVGTDTSGNAPIGLLELAFDDGSGIGDFYGNVKCVAVFKEALSDTELQKLTTI